MIPKIIHYCWFGNSEVPTYLKKYIKSWEKYCPDYEIICWNEENYNINEHPFVREAYNNKTWALVSDYIRLDVVYKYGGIYLDTDVELLKNLDTLLENKLYVGLEQTDFLCNTGLGFGAEKGNDVVKEMRDLYDNISFDKSNLVSISCPILNTKIIKKHVEINKGEIVKKNGIAVFPPRYFDPLSSGKSEFLLCEDSYSMHHYAATWLSTSAKMKRKIIIFVGEKRVYKIKEFIKNIKGKMS